MAVNIIISNEVFKDDSNDDVSKDHTVSEKFDVD
jgi:hypothetical protein